MAYGDNARSMWSYLTKDMGYSPVHAAGILGNVGAESSFNPSIRNDAEGAYGSFQHRGPRLSALEAFARDRNLPIDQFSTQAQFAKHEMDTDPLYMKARDALLATSDPAEAARVFDAQFERSDGKTREARARAAVEHYNTFAGNPDASPLATYSASQNIMQEQDNDLTAPSMVQQSQQPQANLMMGPQAVAPPQEQDPRATLDVSAGLSSLGAGLSAMSQGKVADQASIGQQFYQRRELARQQAENDRKRASIAEALKGYPGGEQVAELVAAGVPIAEAMEMIRSKEGMAHQEKMQLNDFGFRKSESSLDRKQQAALAEAGFQIDYARIDQNARQFAATYALDEDKFAESASQFARAHGLDEQRFVEASKQFAQTYGLDKDRLEQNASQFARSHGLDEQRFVEASKQFAQTYGLDKDRLEQNASQFARSHGLDEQRFVEASKQFAQTYGLDKDRLEQNASQFAKTQGLNERQFVEHVTQFNKSHTLNADKFAQEQMNWAETMSFQKMQYEEKAASERHQGSAGREVIASVFEKAGEKDTAAYIRSRDISAFSDPAMVNQFLQAADQIKPKPDLTKDMKNYMAAQADSGFAAHLKEQAPGGTPEHTKAFYKTLEGREESLSKARDVMASANNMKNLLAISEADLGKVVSTGRVAEFFQPIAEVFKELGLASPNFAKVTTHRELINMIHNDIFPKLRAVGSGSTSDWEGRIMSSAFPGLANSPEAIQMQLDFYINRTQRNLAEQDFLRSYADSDKTMTEATTEWNKLVEEGDPRTVPAMYSDEMKPENFINGFKSGAIKVGSFVHIDGKIHKVNQAMIDSMVGGN